MGVAERFDTLSAALEGEGAGMSRWRKFTI
jgi:hypothetical protein